MTLVVDASVVVKWAIPEVHATSARRLLVADEPLLGPTILPLEIGNILWKKARRRELTEREATQALHRLVGEVRVEDGYPDLLDAALHLAIRYERSLYDALYVALALAEDCQFVTADRRLYNAMAPAFPGTMLWVEDIPVP